jgi:hypothetical protein
MTKHICQQCDKEYDHKALERSQGPTHWTGKYCSAACFTKRTLIEGAVKKRDSGVLSCYECGATDRLCMTPHHCKVEPYTLTGFIFVCRDCEEDLANKDVNITLTERED